MPLSEEELRMLEQMERALVREDPKLVSTLRGTALRRAARRRSLAAVVALVSGIVILMTGAVAQLTVVGIAGFVLMVVAASTGLSAWQAQDSGAGGDGQTIATQGTSGSGPGAFFERFLAKRRRDDDAS
jgi:hypothetical protein